MAKIIGNTTATPTPVSDWSQNDSTKADYIKNKPSIPSNMSDLHNDVGYINTVDNELLTESVNPIQNKAVATAINNLAELVGDSAVSEQIKNAVDTKSDVVHEHDERYYARAEIDDQMSNKSQVQIITWGDDD